MFERFHNRYWRVIHNIAEEARSVESVINDYVDEGYVFHEIDGDIVSVYLKPTYFREKLPENYEPVWSESEDLVFEEFPEFLVDPVPTTFNPGVQEIVSFNEADFPEGTTFRAQVEGRTLPTRRMSGSLKIGSIPDIRGDKVFRLIASKDGYHPRIYEGTVFVNGTNFVPVIRKINGDGSIIVRGEEFEGNVNVFDRDNKNLTFSTEGVEQAVVSIDEDGRFKITPDANAYGPYSFKVIVEDGSGGRAEALVSYTVRVKPQIQDIFLSTKYDSPIEIQIFPDDPDSDFSSLSLNFGTSTGTLESIDPPEGETWEYFKILYTPRESVYVDEISGSITDGDGLTGEFSLVIEVQDNPLQLTSNEGVLLPADDENTTLDLEFNAKPSKLRVKIDPEGSYRGYNTLLHTHKELFEPMMYLYGVAQTNTFIYKLKSQDINKGHPSIIPESGQYLITGYNVPPVRKYSNIFSQEVYLPLQDISNTDKYGNFFGECAVIDVSSIDVNFYVSSRTWNGGNIGTLYDFGLPGEGTIIGTKEDGTDVELAVFKITKEDTSEWKSTNIPGRYRISIPIDTSDGAGLRNIRVQFDPNQVELCTSPAYNVQYSFIFLGVRGVKKSPLVYDMNMLIEATNDIGNSIERSVSFKVSTY